MNAKVGKTIATALMIIILGMVVAEPVLACGGGPPAQSSNVKTRYGTYSVGSASCPAFWPACYTYYIYSDLSITDGALVIEPGAVIKFNNGARIYADAALGGKLIAKGEPYMPIIFTSARDENNGASINDYWTGTPAAGDFNRIRIGKDSEFEYCRVMYATYGVEVYGQPKADSNNIGTIRHNCITNCTEGIVLGWNSCKYADNDYRMVNVFNNLVTHCTGNGITVHTRYGGTVNLLNNTLDANSTGISVSNYCEQPVYITNCLISNCTTTGISDTSTTMEPTITHCGFYGNTNDDSGLSAGVDQEISNKFPTSSPYNSGTFIALGTHYLNIDDPCGADVLIEAGSGSITEAGYDDPCFWAIYHVPDDPCLGGYSDDYYTIENDETWSPNYDLCDNSNVAIGYHHPRVDILIDHCRLSVRHMHNDPTLTISPGTIIAMNTYGIYDGLFIYDDENLICNGDPYGAGYITFVNAGRAGQFGNVEYPPNDFGIGFNDESSNNQISFTRFWELSKAIYFYGENSGVIEDCIFRLNTYGIYLNDGSNDSPVNVTNCLFMQNKYGFYNEGDENFGTFTNCTFNQDAFIPDPCGVTGTTSIYAPDYTTFNVVNCLFNELEYGIDGETSATTHYSTNTSNKNNAFWSNYSNIENDTLVATDKDLDSTTGDPLIGQSLWPDADPANRFFLVQTGDPDPCCIDGGDDPCSVGMFGFTTNIDDTADAAPVDIGYHYLNHDDVDNDGLFDGQELRIGTSGSPNVDSDGDGLVDGHDGLVSVHDYAGGIDRDNDGFVDGELDAGTDPTDPDSDGDGMGDAWEWLHGLNPAYDDAGDDYDGDGLTNYQEFSSQPKLDPTTNNEMIYEYDDAGSVIKQWQVFVKNGQVHRLETQNDYDDTGRIWRKRQLADPDSGIDNSNDMITLTTYDVVGNVDKQVRKGLDCTDPCSIETNDIVVQNVYDDTLTRLETVIDPEGYETQYTYYDDGKVKEVYRTDNTGNPKPSYLVTENTYDDAGRLEKVVDAERHYRTFEYNSLSRVTVELSYDCNGTPTNPADDFALRQVRYEYDGLGHVTRQVVMADADSTSAIATTTDNVVDYSYDGDGDDYPGMLASKTTYYGGASNYSSATTYDYDELGRREVITDPLNNTTTMTYDAMGRVTRQYQVNLHPISGGTNQELTTDYVTDPLGRVRQQRQIADITHPEIYLATTMVYDSMGNLLESFNPSGTETQYDYNAFNQRTEMVADVSGIEQTTEYGYDRLGRQESITGYADGSTAQTTEYDYDKLGRVTEITYPDTKTISYDSYDRNNKVTQRTDQRGYVTGYTYDGLGRLEQKSVTINSVTTVESFTYDGLGRMLTAEKEVNSSDVSSTTFVYTDLGPVDTSTESLFGGTAKTINYTYDQAGQRTRTDYPVGSSYVTTTHDALGRIGTLSKSGTQKASYQYIGSQVVRRTYETSPNDTIYDINYNNLGQADRRWTHIDGGSTITDFGYTFDNNGNIEDQYFTHRDPCYYNHYTYDDLDRLTDADYLVGLLTEDEQFTYDKLGNRTNVNLRDTNNEVYIVNDLTNRYTSVGGENLSYDDAGNQTGDHRGYTYEYDYENRLIEIEDVVSFAYDALGRRIRKINHVLYDYTTLYYYNDNWQVLGEYSGGDTLSRWYIYGNYIDEVLMMVTGGGTEYYYAHDHLTSPVALMNNTGTVLERYEYNAYGKLTRLNPNFTAWSGTESGNPYYFTGRRTDYFNNGTLPLQHNRHRDYDCDTGRWLTQDPMGITPNVTKKNPFKPLLQYTDGMNLYQYVGSGPIMSNDTLGLSPPIPGQPGWAKQCGECGPDITSLMQNMRGAMVRWFYMDNAGYKYGSRSPKNDDDRRSICEDGMCRLNGWDIMELKANWSLYTKSMTSNNCATKDCPNTVRVGSGCYSKDEVNYYVFGVMASICGQYFPDDNSKSLSHYRNLVGLYLYPYASWRYGLQEGNNVNCKYDWFMAGYNGSPAGVSCGNRSPDCKLDGCNWCFKNFYAVWGYPDGNHGLVTVNP